MPGDQLILEITVLRGGKKYYKMEGKATVDGAPAAEAELMATISDK